MYSGLFVCFVFNVLAFKGLSLPVHELLNPLWEEPLRRYSFCLQRQVVLQNLGSRVTTLEAHGSVLNIEAQFS